MDLRVFSMGGKIRRHDIDLVFKAIHTFVQSRFNPVDLFRKHLETLSNKRELLMKILPLDCQLMLKFFFDFIFESE